MAKEMTADNAIFLLHDVYLPALKRESGTTRKVLEAVPPGKSDHRPDPASRSAIELVRHIAIADLRFVETPIAGVFNTGITLPENSKTPAEIATWYAERLEKDLDALTNTTGGQLAKMVDFRGMFQMPAVSFLGLGMHHTIHHRGQLSSYLRCMGAKVPPIYGDSYDSEQARKAQA